MMNGPRSLRPRGGLRIPADRRRSGSGMGVSNSRTQASLWSTVCGYHEADLPKQRESACRMPAYRRFADPKAVRKASGCSTMALKHGEITEQILQSFYKVYHVLGHGFLEKVYENSLAVELRERGLSVQQQAPIRVLYKGRPVGEYFADLLVEETVIVEIKAAQALTNEHFAQLINYLKATGIEVGLLLNFGPRPEVRSKVFETAKEKESGEEARRGDPRASVRVRSPREIQDLGGEDGTDNADR